MKARNDGRHLDEFGHGIMWPQKNVCGVFLPCFECGDITTGRHHVVPRSSGGRRQLPLCTGCHTKVHGSRTIHPELIKEGLRKAVARGVVLGPPIKVTPKKVARILALRKVGNSFKTISKIARVSVGSAHRVCKENLNA